jgi:hypothetical protein
LEELLKSRVDERGRQELVTPEAFEELQEALTLGRDCLPGECRLPASSYLLSRARSGGEMVSRVQARVLSNKAFETVELVQEEALGQALLPYSGRSLLASDGSLVSPGG